MNEYNNYMHAQVLRKYDNVLGMELTFIQFDVLKEKMLFFAFKST